RSPMTPRRDIRVPELRPLRFVDQAAELVAAVPVDDCEAEVQAAADQAEWRRAEREERAKRSYRPPFRCLSCHRYTSSAVSECRGCGHVGARADEGERTSYASAHARRRARKALRR